MTRDKMTLLTPIVFAAIIFAMAGISFSTLLPTFAYSIVSPSAISRSLIQILQERTTKYQPKLRISFLIK